MWLMLWQGLSVKRDHYSASHRIAQREGLQGRELANNKELSAPANGLPQPRSRRPDGAEDPSPLPRRCHVHTDFVSSSIIRAKF